MTEQNLTFEQLLTHFQTTDPKDRRDVIFDIAHSNDPRALDWILETFEQADNKLKTDLMWYGLRFFDDPKAITTLIQSLD